MFDLQAFERAEFKPRTRRVEVEALAPFFPEGTKPEWEVRGLTSAELNRTLEAEKRQSSVEAIVKALAANGNQVQALREAIGLTSGTPGEIAKRLEMLAIASVAPKIELPLAVKLAENFPIEFFRLTNAITDLTGQGAEATDLGKPAAASQPTPA